MGKPLSPSERSRKIKDKIALDEAARQNRHIDKLREGMKKRMGQLFQLDERLFKVGEAVVFQRSENGREFQGTIAGWNPDGKVIVLRVGTKEGYAFDRNEIHLIRQTAEMPTEVDDTANMKLSEIAKGHSKNFPKKLDRLIKSRNKKRKDAA